MSKFRVLQFNIQFGQAWDEADPDHAPINLEATIAEIKRHDADIILLQEVEHALPGGQQQQPPPNYGLIKEALTGYHSWFSYPKADPRELPFGIGLAIFSRFALTRVMRCEIPSPEISFEFYGTKTTPTDRLMIGLQTEVDGHSLDVFNTHLLAFFMLGASSEGNSEQPGIVLNQLRDSKKASIVSGDFNVSNHKSLTKQFSEAGLTTVQDQENTWRRRPYVLDHIFYNAQLRCVAHEVIATPTSDHHALVADFEFVD